MSRADWWKAEPDQRMAANLARINRAAEELREVANDLCALGSEESTLNDEQRVRLGASLLLVARRKSEVESVMRTLPTIPADQDPTYR